jgi:hypothetical protein
MLTQAPPRGLPRSRFIVLFAVMLVTASGNTALQSLMPAIGRGLGISDFLITLAFSLSAIIWVVTAPLWARRADRRGRRAMMRLGLTGFILSMLICGLVLAAGLHGAIGATAAFFLFVFGRCFYGAWGSASPPAVQAYVAARTDREARTNAMAALASSFGLGTIIGPAIAPLFIIEPAGLSGPLIAFAVIAAAVLTALILHVPDDTPDHGARGRVVSYPALGLDDGSSGVDEDVPAGLRWRDPRIFRWNLIGLVGGHGHAGLLGVIGFLVIDRLSLPLEQAQHSIAIVLIAGAAATLLAQWWLIPLLRLSPRDLVATGCMLSAVGALVAGLSGELYGITLGFAVASIGFGFFRPGFTSGASLAVHPHEQNEVAGMTTSVNGAAFVAAPAVGVALYGLGLAAPFITIAAIMLTLSLCVLWINPSARAG